MVYIHLYFWLGATAKASERGKNRQKCRLPLIKSTTRGCCIAPRIKPNVIVHMYKISADPHPRWLNSGVQILNILLLRRGLIRLTGRYPAASDGAKTIKKVVCPASKSTTRGCCIAPRYKKQKNVHMYKISADPHPRWLNSGGPEILHIPYFPLFFA